MPKIKVSSGSYDPAGRFIPGCKVTVLVTGGGLATIYSDQAGAAQTNPFTADDSGTWEFYADPALYDISVQRRGSAIFTQESVAIGFVPYVQRPGGTFSLSSDVIASGGAVYSVDDSPWIRSPETLIVTSLGEPVRYQDTVGNIVVNGVRFSQAAHWPTLDSDFEYVAMKYDGDFARNFIVYFDLTLYPDSAWDSYITLAVVDGDDWEAGTYTEKSVSDTVHYSSLNWAFVRVLNKQVDTMRMEPGDVLVPLVDFDTTGNWFAPDVSLTIKP